MTTLARDDLKGLPDTAHILPALLGKRHRDPREIPYAVAMACSSTKARESLPKNNGHHRVFTAAAVGSAVEFYDFFIYGIAAALVFPTVFFPHLDVTTARLASFATLGAAFVARPAGALFFGHHGDRIGRKRVLISTLLLMGLATAGVGIVPGAASIGNAAPAMVLALRIVQGFALGGEQGSAVVLATESAPKNRKGLMGTAGAVGALVGIIASNVSFLIVNLLDAGHASAFLSWGWRVPFLISSLLVLIGLYIRVRVPESPEFLAARDCGKLSHAPALALLRHWPSRVFLVAGAIYALLVLSFVRDSFVVSYANVELQLSLALLLTITTIGGVFGLVVVVVSGHLSDRFSPQSVFLVGATLMVMCSALVAPVLNAGTVPAFAATILLTHLATGVANGAAGTFLTSAFPIHLRNSGYGIAQNIASVFGGGLSPLVATSLNSWGGLSAVSDMFIVASLISLACAATLAMRPRKAA